MAGIGDEIGAQAVGARDLGHVAQQKQGSGAVAGGPVERQDIGIEIALDRDGDSELHRFRLGAREHPIDCREQLGLADDGDEVAPDRRIAVELFGGIIGQA